MTQEATLHSPWIMRSGWKWLPAFVSAGLVLLWSGCPLGIPGEWTWAPLDWPQPILLSATATALAGGLYWGVVRAQLLRSAAGQQPRLWAVWLAALCWLVVLQEFSSPRQQLAKGAFVLYYPSSSGYFFKARYEAPDARPFLQTYPELMRQGDVLHVGTHPPGLFLIFHALLAADPWLAPVTDFVESLSPPSVAAALDTIAENSQSTATPLTQADRRILWLAILGAHVIAVAGIWPLARLLQLSSCRVAAAIPQPIATSLSSASAVASRTMSREPDPIENEPRYGIAAVAIASLWPLVPAVATFLPKADAIYPTLGLWLLCWLVEGIANGKVSRIVLSAAASAGCLVLSLCFLPHLLAGWLLLASPLASRQGPWIRRLAKVARNLGCWAAGFVLAVLVLSGLLGLYLPDVWRLNYLNHAGFYLQYPRSYLGWLFVNPVELAFAAGWPIALLAAAGLIATLHAAFASRDSVDAAAKPSEQDSAASPPTLHSALTLSTAAVWAILWLTGKNSGEAARLWLPLMPWLLVWCHGGWAVLGGVATSTTAAQASATAMNRSRSAESSDPENQRVTRWLLWLIAWQLVAAAGTVWRVGGFDFGQ